MTDYQIVSKSVRIWMGLVARIPALGRQTSVPFLIRSQQQDKVRFHPSSPGEDSELITEHG